MKKFTNIIVAAAAGFAAGSAMGILFAPEKGEKTRNNISKKSKKYLQKINDQMSTQKLKELKNEFEGQLNKINEK